MTEQRAESRKEFEENRDELVGMIAAIQEAKQIIKQLKPSSFLQESSSIFAEIKDHHSQFSKDGG